MTRTPPRGAHSQTSETVQGAKLWGVVEAHHHALVGAVARGTPSPTPPLGCGFGGGAVLQHYSTCSEALQHLL